ncbi:hypothetical protein ACHAQC_011911, partial [Fusarium culmorum]
MPVEDLKITNHYYRGASNPAGHPARTYIKGRDFRDLSQGELQRIAMDQIRASQ